MMIEFVDAIGAFTSMVSGLKAGEELERRELSPSANR